LGLLRRSVAKSGHRDGHVGRILTARMGFPKGAGLQGGREWSKLSVSKGS
jgi:hypothetical protein